MTASEGSMETFIVKQENQNTMKKTQRDVALLTEFHQTKGETRRDIAEIPPAELNKLSCMKLLSEFAFAQRKDNNTSRDRFDGW